MSFFYSVFMSCFTVNPSAMIFCVNFLRVILKWNSFLQKFLAPSTILFLRGTSPSSSCRGMSCSATTSSSSESFQFATRFVRSSLDSGGRPKLGCLSPQVGAACSHHQQVCSAFQPPGRLFFPFLTTSFQHSWPFLSTHSWVALLLRKLSSYIITRYGPVSSHQETHHSFTAFCFLSCTLKEHQQSPGYGHPYQFSVSTCVPVIINLY